MSRHIDNILEKSEHKKWEGKINRKVIITGLIFSLVIIIAISSFFFTKETINYTSNGQPKQINGSLIGLGILVIGLAILFIRNRKKSTIFQDGVNCGNLFLFE